MTIQSRRWGPPPEGLRDPRSKGDWARLYVNSALDARGGPDFEDLRHFALFIGYARSGHTLVGTMLNAHPEVVIAHERDAVGIVRHRFSRRQLYSLLLQRDQQFGTIGRSWSGYQYEIPGQYQGRFERLRVIGDKRARSAVLQFARDPKLLDRLRTRVGVPIRVLHVTRNPFDNIATEARRHKLSLTEATGWYEQICRAIRNVRPLLDPSELLDVRYETFVTDTAPALAELCHFIGVEPEDSYLEACAGIVWPSTNRSRDAVEWTDTERQGVERLIEMYDVLNSYSFDE
jgi:Sulfotransferase family